MPSVFSSVADLPPAYRNLRHRGSRTTVPDSVLAEGHRTVRRALESDREILSLALTPEWYGRLREEIVLRNPPVGSVYVVPGAELDRAVGFRLRQGIMAEVRIPAPLPEERWVRELPEPHLLVGIDGLTDAENVGAVARNAAAFGAQGFLSDRGSVNPFLRRVARVSLGAIFCLPTRCVPSLPETLQLLRKTRGTSIIATHLGEDAEPPGAVDWTGNLCLVLGSEDAGVSEACLGLADRRVRIPMRKGWDSINVAAASAVLLHAAMERRSNVREET